VSLISCSRTERGKAFPGTAPLSGGERECPKRLNREGSSTDPGSAGGLARSSDEALLGAVGWSEGAGSSVAVFCRSTGQMPGRSQMGELKSSGKSFEISKQEVWKAFQRVKANKGARVSTR